MPHNFASRIPEAPESKLARNKDTNFCASPWGRRKAGCGLADIESNVANTLSSSLSRFVNFTCKSCQLRTFSMGTADLQDGGSLHRSTSQAACRKARWLLRVAPGS